MFIISIFTLFMISTPQKVVQGNYLCFICEDEPPKSEKVKVFGRSHVDIDGLIRRVLDVDVNIYSDSDDLFICSKICYKRLQKFQKLTKELDEVKETLKQSFKKPRSKRQSNETAQRTSKSSRSLQFDSSESTTYTSYPASLTLYQEQLPCLPIAAFPQPLTSTPIRRPKDFGEQRPTTTSVSVTVKYPSKTVNKTLKEEYHCIGKALVHGPPENIAKAVLKCKPITKFVVSNVLLQLSSEVNRLCSRKKPSLLRNSGKDDLKNFRFESVCKEWEERAPTFYSFLISVAVNRNKKVSWLPSVAVAGSILLKQRNAHLSATANTIAIMLKTGSIEANLNRLCKMKVTSSNQSILKKITAMGEGSDMPLQMAKDKITKENVKREFLEAAVHEVSSSPKVNTAVSYTDTNDLQCTSIEQSEVAALKKELEDFQSSCHKGYAIVFDNIDLEIKPKNMTMLKQNKTVHWVNHKMVENRVSGNYLPCKSAQCELFDVPNISFLPSTQEYRRQRHDYIVLVSRVLADYFTCFSPFMDSCVKHIPHKYNKEMSQKSEKVPLGIIFKNENENDGMLEILQEFQTYIPRFPTENNKFDAQIVTGDQLSVERAVNVVESVSNGYTQEDRLEGFNFQLGDWHAALKVLTRIFKRFYTVHSEVDVCTLFCDRTLINRRNVKADPKDAYRADRDFILLIVKSRIVVAAMEVLGIKDKDGQPTKFSILDAENQNKEMKRQCIHKAAALIVDGFVSKESETDILKEMLRYQDDEERKNNQEQTVDGKYPCRFPGCTKSFKKDGASRIKHELTHNPTDSSTNEASTSIPKKEEKDQDDIYNYNCALLDDGLFYMNFLDAISEGDGVKIMRHYKYLLLSFRADGKQSCKYALESLYQLFLVLSDLSPRDAERFTWNRSVNTFGGMGKNIPLDLDMEHSNRFVKQAIKNMGPNVNENAISRICRAERDMRTLLNDLDQSLHRKPVSGKHSSCSSIDNDLKRLIDRALANDVFTKHKKRQYKHFKDFERDQLKGLNMSSMYNWINYHKKNVLLGIKAR